jgi:hypothetical protein
MLNQVQFFVQLFSSNKNLEVFVPKIDLEIYNNLFELYSHAHCYVCPLCVVSSHGLWKMKQFFDSHLSTFLLL